MPHDDIKMSEHLRALIDAAKAHVMTQEERRAQMLSFVWGNMPQGNTATKQELAKAIRKQEGIVG